MTNKIFSFFSGSGFLDLGFEKNEYEVVFVNEYHMPFLNAYKHSRKILKLPEPIYGYSSESIEALESDKKFMHQLSGQVIKERKSGNISGFIGGPPCPDFSVGGKNRGKEGENGRLSQTYCNVVCATRPDFFVFENVKGLWRTKRHREFYEQLKDQFRGADYLLSDRLTNCLEFGAPQDRDRIILIGLSKSLLKRLSINDEETLGNTLTWAQHVSYDTRTVLELPWPDRDEYSENNKRNRLKSLPKTLTVEHWFKKNKVDTHPNSKHHFIPRAALPKFKIIAEGDTSKKSFKRLHRWRFSPTAAYGNNEVHIHPYLPRRISAAEALAIQSLPAEFEFPSSMSLSNMFKSIGNGVPFLMASGIAVVIKDLLDNIKQNKN